MKQIFALLMLPFVLLAAEGALIDGKVVPAATYLYENSSVIYLPCGINLDTRNAETAQPSNQALSDGQTSMGVYLIHFDGPIYSHESRALEQEGVILEGYIPNYAYVVRMDKSLLSRVSNLPGVDWIGDYRPVYKICPELNLKAGVPEKLEVILYPGIDAESIRKTVESLGGVILDSYASKWSTKVQISLAPSQISSLVQEPQIKWIEPFRVMRTMNNQAQWVIQTWESGNRKIWDKGLKGQGQILANLDSGVRTSHNFFRDPSVSITTWGNYPSHRKIIAYIKPFVEDKDSFATFGDESGHGTHTAGSMTGYDQPVGGTSANIGMAPESKFYVLDGGGVGDGIAHAVSLEYSLTLAYFGNSAGGARIISNSWGSQTTRAYDASCKESDQTMWDYPDYLVCFSAGNNPPSAYSGSPANAKDVLCVGASQNGALANIAAALSSSGPTADGRIRPDIVAPGENVISSVNTGDAAEESYSGTSMSCPVAAGNAALVRQYFTDGWYPSGAPSNSQKFTPSASLIKAMMINSVNKDYTAFQVPAAKIGWGRPELDNVLYFPGDNRKLAVVDFDEGLETGYQFFGSVNIDNSDEPLRITLNWTDYPGTEYANPALVNDLNLQVISPSGKIYLGNVFSANASTEGGSFDVKNPVENVFIDSPEEGTWKIQVIANNIPRGPQPFALVVTGGLSAVMNSVVHDATIIDDAGQSNPDGSLDPAEEATLYVVLKNTGGSTLTNLSATLSTTSSRVTIIDNTCSYGNLNAGATGQGDGFKIKAPATDTVGTFADLSIALTSSELTGTLDFEIMIGTPRYTWTDHDAGTVMLTVAQQGAIGFLGNEPNDMGHGFRYPKDSDSTWLYHATFAAGNSKSYLNDRFYGDDASYTNAKDWKVSSSPDGRVIIGAHVYSDQESKAIYTDDGNSTPKGLKVTQYGYAWKDKSYVALKFVLENTSTSAMNSMYAGIIADFDMGARSDSNKVGTDQTIDLAYEKRSSTDNPHVGVKLLQGTKANISGLQNSVYVYDSDNNHVWREDTCWKFLKGDLKFPSSATIADWSVVVSAGPFNLTPGGTDTVAFAFVAGDDLASLQANAKDAQTTWDNLDFFAVEEGPGGPARLDLMLAPGLITGQGSIRFSIPKSANIRLDVFDLAGRHVNTLVNGNLNAGQHEIFWNGRDTKNTPISKGVYFIVLNTPDGTVVGKSVILK